MAKKLRDLDSVIGQKNIVKWFKGCIARDALPQVLMLMGPAGIGKTSVAKIVACEVAYSGNASKIEAAKKAVIDEDKSTDAVKLYNMSNLKSQEAVSEVKADLTVGFSSTGRKVIIMDEAHGMSDEAQDSLLTAFESLPLGVYIIVCSTEIESFRDAFLSRCLLRRFSSLTDAEMHSLLKRRIKENKLQFSLSTQMVISLIANYSGNEPRRALNLIDSFEHGSMVTVEDLQSFINVYETKEVVILIDRMYNGNYVEGLSLIQDMNIEKTFVNSVLEVLKVSQGESSSIIDHDSCIHIVSEFRDRDINNLIGFAIDCATCSRLTRNKLCGFFLKWCTISDKLFSSPIVPNEDKVHLEDLSMMNNMIEQHEVQASPFESYNKSLEMLLSEAETIE